jgi:lipooligosaccharide transport system permease protein
MNTWIKEWIIQSSLFHFPMWSRDLLRVWYRNFFYFKKRWMVSFFWIALEPTIVLASLGFGLGSYVKDIDGRPYSDFFFPGLLCSTAMFVSFFEATYANLGKLRFQNIYITMLHAPLAAEDIALGEILWSATKGTLSAAALGVFGLLLGLINASLFPSLVVVFILCWFFASLGTIMITLVRSYDDVIYPTSGLIVPMSLFCGVYFPIEPLSIFFKIFIYALPLTHAVNLVRHLSFGTLAPWDGLHLLTLLIFAMLTTNVAVARFSRQLMR